MNSIEAMESEIRNQSKDLLSVELHEPRGDCLFVGSGDSYAASLAACYASRGVARCCHPNDLVVNPCIADGRIVYFVSVSGRTSANIHAARVAKKSAKHTVAVTTNPGSALASYCDEVVQLKYDASPITTAGTVSFAASVITCLSLSFKAKFPQSISKLLKASEKQAENVVRLMRAGRKSFFILGDGMLFPTALYGSMKLNEVIGARAFAYPAEEFCHSPLFSITKKDAILILGEQKTRLRPLAERLAAEGYESTFVHISQDEILGTILHSTFFVQMLALKLAQKLKLKECYFLQNKRLLQVSSDFIYG